MTDCMSLVSVSLSLSLSVCVFLAVCCMCVCLSWCVCKGKKVVCVCGAGKEGDGSVVMEQLCLLLRLAAHVLADPGEGETPLIPLSMAQASQASLAAGQVWVSPL